MDRKERYTQLLEEIEHPRELSELAQKVDISKSTVRKYLGELVDKGRAKRVKKGIYRRTEEGSDWLSRQQEEEVEVAESTSEEKDWDPLLTYPLQYSYPVPGSLPGSFQWMDDNPGKVEMGAGGVLVATGACFLADRRNVAGTVFAGLGLLVEVDGFARMLGGRGVEKVFVPPRRRRRNPRPR